MRPLWGTKIKWVVQEEADWKEERRMASISLQHQEKEPSKVIYVLSEWVCPHRESSRVTTRRGRRYRRILSPSDHTLLLLYTIEPSIRSERVQELYHAAVTLPFSCTGMWAWAAHCTQVTEDLLWAIASFCIHQTSPSPTEAFLSSSLDGRWWWWWLRWLRWWWPASKREWESWEV